MGQPGPAGYTLKDQDPVVDHKDHQDSTGCKVVPRLLQLTAPGEVAPPLHAFVDSWFLQAGRALLPKGLCRLPEDRKGPEGDFQRASRLLAGYHVVIPLVHTRRQAEGARAAPPIKTGIPSPSPSLPALRRLRLDSGARRCPRTAM